MVLLTVAGWMAQISYLCNIYCRINTPRKEGGLGHVNIPILSDLTHQISRDYGVLLENEGHTLRFVLKTVAIDWIKTVDAFRGLFIIDNRGVLRQITMNDLPVGYVCQTVG